MNQTQSHALNLGFDPRASDAYTRFQDRRHLQQFLFRPQFTAPTLNSVYQLCQRLIAQPILAGFQVWIVGSILHRPDSANDIDVLLTRRDCGFLHMERLERALILIRAIGLYTLGISADACYRNTTGDALAGVLHRKKTLSTIKLEDHILTLGMQIGYLEHIRRIGRFSVIQRRQASEVNFFKKLPLFSARRETDRFLVPGVPIEDFVGATTNAKKFNVVQQGS